MQTVVRAAVFTAYLAVALVLSCIAAAAWYLLIWGVVHDYPGGEVIDFVSMIGLAGSVLFFGTRWAIRNFRNYLDDQKSVA